MLTETDMTAVIINALRNKTMGHPCPVCGVVKPVNKRVFAQYRPLRCPKCKTELDPLPEFPEPDVPEGWRLHVQPDRRYHRDCYRRAHRFFWDLRGEPGARLVHGTILAADLAIPHAWVDLPGGIIFDGVWQRFLWEADYQRLRGAVRYQSYDRENAALCVLRFSTYGPWPVEAACSLPDGVSDGGG